MKISYKLVAMFYLAIFNLSAMEQNMNTQLTPKGALSLQSADSNHFSGKAEFIRYPIMPSSGDVAPAIVYFKPNSFTDWHSHSQGQYLIITEGTGRFQQWGKPIQIISKGDVIWIAPNIKHWHGAGELTAMSHVAISPAENNQVTWMEKVQIDETPNDVQLDKIQNNQLTSRQLAIIPLAIAVTQGDQDAERTAIEQGLKNGLTVNELKEIISHQFSYIGAPKNLNGMMTLKSLLEHRAEQGMNDPQGELPTELGDVDYYQRGTQKLAALTQRSTQSALFDFAPAIDYAIKAQLFGYQFSRDNLGDVERELTTIGSLVGLGESVNPQLRSHLTLMKNLNLTDQSFNQLLTMVTPKQANNLRMVWMQANNKQ